MNLTLPLKRECFNFGEILTAFITKGSDRGGSSGARQVYFSMNLFCAHPPRWEQENKLLLHTVFIGLGRELLGGGRNATCGFDIRNYGNWKCWSQERGLFRTKCGELLSRWGHSCLFSCTKHKEEVIQKSSAINCLILWIWHYCIIHQKFAERVSLKHY